MLPFALALLLPGPAPAATPADPGALYAPGASFAIDDRLASTSVFHWYTSNAGQVSGPWRPPEGRSAWTGGVGFWRGQVKQIMAANIDIMYVHLIPAFEQQRRNLFQALHDLRAEGYQVPRTAPFLDPMITWSGKPNVDLATEAGKDHFVDQYIRFFEQYYAANTDLHADDYLARIDGRVVLDAWHLRYNTDNMSSLSRADVEGRLADHLADHPVFADGIYMVGTATTPALGFADERVHQFEVHAYHQASTHRGITSVQVKPGYWDQNLAQRTPGYQMKRDGGGHYREAWAGVNADPSADRVYIESFNEYDEGSGIHAADPGPPYVIPENGNTATDLWSDTADPYEYIRTTAAGARLFNSTPDYGAAILWHDLPREMASGETRTVTVVIRNEGDLAWSAAGGFGFGQRPSAYQQVPFGAGLHALDDDDNEIPEYGGVFRGRAMTMSLSLTAPRLHGEHTTHWSMHHAPRPPQVDDATVFNWHLNTPGRPDGEGAAGLVNAIATTALHPVETPEDAFGAIGGLEPTSLIFADGGAVDNGNLVPGDGQEQVDSIRFSTALAVPLRGYSIHLATDYGLQNEYRSTALVEFSVDGQVVDLFDNDGMHRIARRLFPDGPVTGRDFLVRLTRATSGGPRVMEIDAILAGPPILEQNSVWFGEQLTWTVNVAPEPGGLLLLAPGLVLLAARRR